MKQFIVVLALLVFCHPAYGGYLDPVAGSVETDPVAGAVTGLVTADGAGNITGTATSTFATSAQGSTADTALQPGDVDDIAVDSATTDPVSSNWAYDHNASTAVHGQTDLDNPVFDTASWTAVTALGSQTTSFSVDFATSQNQAVTLTANTITLTLDTTTIGIGGFTLWITNGGLATLTWAAETGSVYWPGGTDPTLTSSGVDVVACKFDGTNFYCAATLDFQ